MRGCGWGRWGEGGWGGAILVAEQRSINYRSALTSSEPSRSWRVALLYAVHRGQCRTIIYSYIFPHSTVTTWKT